jgi:hypothetical protein
MYIEFINYYKKDINYKFLFSKGDDFIKFEDITNYEYNIDNQIICVDKIYLLVIESTNNYLLNFFNEKKKNKYLLRIFNENFKLLFSEDFLKSTYESFEIIYKNNKNYFYIKFYIYF